MDNIEFSNTFILNDIDKKEASYAAFFYGCKILSEYIEKNVPGDTVVAVMENSYRLVQLLFSIMFTDKRVVVIDPLKGSEELLDILSDYTSAPLFVAGVKIIPADIGHKIIPFPDITEAGSLDIPGIKKYTLAKFMGRPFFSPYLVTFTSGTSGTTKGVEHNLNSLFLSALSLHSKVGVEGATFLHVMPMTYMAGILNALIYPFVIGAKIVLAHRFSVPVAMGFWQMVEKYKVRLFWLSPSMLAMIDQLDRGRAGEAYCKKRKTTFLVGTAPLPKQLRQRFNERYSTVVYASYGLSETLFISVENVGSLARSEENCVGEILDGVDYRVDDTGEMLVRVPWMFLRYTNEDAGGCFAGGYYKTGDLAKTKGGCLYITGRCKDLIIKGGMNLSPALIENAMGELEFIQEAAAVGVQDVAGEERVCCIYTYRTGCRHSDGDEGRIKQSVVERLGKSYALDFVGATSHIPKNINGKIDKESVRRMVEAQFGK